jgi:hypothetical protein
MKTKSDYVLLLLLLANNNEQLIYAKQEAQKIIQKKKMVKQLDNDGSTLVLEEKSVKALEKKFGISFE